MATHDSTHRLLESLGIASSTTSPPEEEAQSLKEKEEELLKHYEAAKKEKKEIPWLKQWLAKEEERKKAAGDRGPNGDDADKLPEIHLSREQQKAEMQELIKLIEKKKQKPKSTTFKKRASSKEVVEVGQSSTTKVEIQKGASSSDYKT